MSIPLPLAPLTPSTLDGPALRALAAKVARVHGGHTPSLHELHAAVERLVDGMEGKHPTAALRAEVRTHAHDFALPEGACNSYRRLYQTLEELDRALAVEEPGSPA